MIHIMVKMRKGEKAQNDREGHGSRERSWHGEEAHEGATWEGGRESTKSTDSQPIINPVT